jgi:hypothetical protein
MNCKKNLATLSRTVQDWQPDKNPKAPTLSRQASGRGSIKKPALTKAALLREARAAPV